SIEHVGRLFARRRIQSRFEQQHARARARRERVRQDAAGRAAANDDGVETIGHAMLERSDWFETPDVPCTVTCDGDGNGCHNHWTIKHAWEESPMSHIPLTSHIVRRTLPVMILIAAAGATSEPARAEYPERQITMIACFPAGGGTDIAARLINVPLGEALGKPVIVENRAGAGGNIGIAAAARAGGDGYTLLVCSSAYGVNPSLYAQATYDPYKDFVPVMVIGASPNVFVVPAQSDIKTMPELLARAKASPGKLNWTSPGAGTTPYLAGEVLKLRTGINILHIPFTGAGPATTAVLAGQVDLYTANIGSVGALIDAGKVRPIAVTSKERWPDLPTVPSLEELGIKDAVSLTAIANARLFADGLASTYKLALGTGNAPIARPLAPDLRQIAHG